MIKKEANDITYDLKRGYAATPGWWGVIITHRSGCIAYVLTMYPFYGKQERETKRRYHGLRPTTMTWSTNNAMLQGETKSRQERIEENDNTADIIGMYGTLEKLMHVMRDLPTKQWIPSKNDGMMSEEECQTGQCFDHHTDLAKEEGEWRSMSNARGQRRKKRWSRHDKDKIWEVDASKEWVDHRRGQEGQTRSDNSEKAMTVPHPLTLDSS